MSITKNLRFHWNQQISTGNSTVSSASGTYPFANALDPIRSKLYQPTSNVWNIEWDFGWSAPNSFFGIVGTIDKPFTISEAATMTLKADNIPSNWTTPAFSSAIVPSDYGALLNMDNSGGGYRYWRLDVDDSLNPVQNEVGFMYLGDHVDITERDINRGFSKTLIDPTVLMRSVNGTLYSDKRQKRLMISNIGMGYIPGEERRLLEQMYWDFGIDTPLFVSLDPTLSFSTYDWELTRLVNFTAQPQFTNFSNDKYSMAFTLQESV
jgi:hypothetical protein